MVLTPPPLPTRFPCWCRAVYSWGGESKRDLGFIEGDLIECLNAGDGSWWTGRLRRDKRMVGLFPSNFVEVLPEGFRPVSRSTSPLPGSNTPSPKNTPQKSKTFRKPFEAYAKAPHYTTAKQPETYRESPRLLHIGMLSRDMAQMHPTTIEALQVWVGMGRIFRTMGDKEILSDTAPSSHTTLDKEEISPVTAPNSLMTIAQWATTRQGSHLPAHPHPVWRA
ncbi:hypothetical protein NKR23_g6359 [Pleurostoma richardsiae]|uniref:SH3 domain-containing protein n=1 Tax=Pleurostoma richardsiae TaxID=41990 RepID=A0AA38RLB5_9PEZI|nr:hypothetical protein NKR23_g6359 [Pleurostoma richardsiae]